MSCTEGAISSVQSWVREYLAPALQLNMWKTQRQLPVSACFNWFIFCSSEQKCWGHGSLTQHDAQVRGLESVPIPEPVGLILLQLGTHLQQTGSFESLANKPSSQTVPCLLRCLWVIPELFPCSTWLPVWMCWLVERVGTGAVLCSLALGGCGLRNRLHFFMYSWLDPFLKAQGEVQASYKMHPCKSCIELDWCFFLVLPAL